MKIFSYTESEDPVYELYSKIRKKIEERLNFVCESNKGLEDIDNYGTEFRYIGIICIIVSQRLIEWGVKERKLIKRKAKEADIRLYIDYDRFIKETPKNQELMYIKNIIDSINVVIERSEGDFKGELLKKDILEALGVKESQLIEI